MRFVEGVLRGILNWLVRQLSVLTLFINLNIMFVFPSIRTVNFDLREESMLLAYIAPSVSDKVVKLEVSVLPFKRSC